MATQKERFLKYLQTCVKSTRATESNPLLLGGNAPKTMFVSLNQTAYPTTIQVNGLM